jgi:hypothetical protein
MLGTKASMSLLEYSSQVGYWQRIIAILCFNPALVIIVIVDFGDYFLNHGMTASSYKTPTVSASTYGAGFIYMPIMHTVLISYREM